MTHTTDAVQNLLKKKKTLVMGIMNITPDSFSGDGLLYASPDHILKKANELVDAGADILDLGAESTRPGAPLLSCEEELNRLMPCVEAIAQNMNTIVSIDTRKSEVAKQALQLGAHIINDISGLQDDPKLMTTVRDNKGYIIIVHNFGDDNLRVVKTELGSRFIPINSVKTQPLSIIKRVKTQLLTVINACKACGIKDKYIWIDPGFGFQKTVDENIELLSKLNELGDLSYPLVLGVSRKSMIGYTTTATVDQRLGGSLAAMTYGVLNGARIVRVHDVFESSQAIQMLERLRDIA